MEKTELKTLNLLNVFHFSKNMSCPDCGCKETITDSGEVFCKKCGLELDDLPIFNASKNKNGHKVIRLNEITFEINPEKELYALRLGLKNNKLREKWQHLLGFNVDGLLKKELKDKALILIKKAFEKHSKDLLRSKVRLQSNWGSINNKYFIEIEKYLRFNWPSEEFKCYLSLCTKFGFHNSPGKFIIIQHELNSISNYVIGHELFHILFRAYIDKHFKEKFTQKDKRISKVVAVFVLLRHDKISKCFPEMDFSFNIFADEYKMIANKIWPLWKEQESFKEFIINSYDELNIKKKWISY